MAIELRVVQFWSKIILVISNQTRAACSFDFEITRMISDQIALHLVQLPLYMKFLMLFSSVVKSSSFHFFVQEELEQQAASLSSELQETKTT